MATLSQGTLLKLLQNITTAATTTTTTTATSTAGSRRSPILQVIGIVPATSASDPLNPHRGFYLNLSDSQNSTYVSLSDQDSADLILSNRLHLSQFVHLDRLVFVAPPFPTPVNLRVVTSRLNHQPFVGSPQPLIVRASTSGFVIQPAANEKHFDAKENMNLNFNAKEADDGRKRVPQSKAGGEESPNFSSIKAFDQKGSKINVSYDDDEKEKAYRTPGAAAKKQPDKPRPASAGKRDPSPAGKKRSVSPAPSKCVVPSLAAAKEESRRSSREPAIVVPSRYRQPSPTAGRRQGSPAVAARRMSLSPGRRLSGGVKSGGIDSSGKKKTSGVVVGMCKGLEGAEGSVRSSRKSWGNESGGKNRPDFEAILRTQAAISRRLSDVHDNVPSDVRSSATSVGEKHVHGEEEKELDSGPVITIHEKKWTDGSVPLDKVSSVLAKFGKDAMQRRNIASKAAAEALEEALVTESLVRSLSMFSELVLASKPGNPLPAIDRFMSIYEDVLKSNAGAESLSVSCYSSLSHETVSKEQPPKASSTLWVEAALATNLEVISLLTNPSFENQSKTSKKQGSSYKNSTTAAAIASSSVGGTWARGQGMNETVDFGKRLRSEMQMWFLRFVEESLEAGFQVFGKNGAQDNGGGGLSCGPIAAILSQLKRVNEWLDRVAKGDQAMSEKIERLKRKIYGFVIQHVGTTAENTTISAEVL